MGLHLTGSSVTQLNNAFARLSGVQATVTADGAAVLGSHNPVDATSGNRTITLADASSQGQLVVVSKKDAGANTVTVSVSHLRDGGAGSITLVGQYEAITLTSKADGSWWPVGDHKTKAYFDATYNGRRLGTTTAQASLPFVNVKDYNAKGDDTTDDASAINAAITAAASAGGMLFFPPGTYLCGSTITLKGGVHLWGMGVGGDIFSNTDSSLPFKGAVLKLKSSANVDLIKTENFDTLTGSSAPSVYTTPARFGLHHLVLDGNKQGNTSGLPLRIFGKAYQIDNVVIQNGAAGGAYSEYGTGGYETESRWANFNITDCAGDGLTWKGPHDSQLINGVVARNSGYRGIFIDPAAYTGGEQWANVHVWGTHTYQWVIGSTNASFMNCTADGGGIQVLRYGNEWNGGSILGTLTAGEVAITLGDGTARTVSSNTFRTRVHNFKGSMLVRAMNNLTRTRNRYQISASMGGATRYVAGAGKSATTGSITFPVTTIAVADGSSFPASGVGFISDGTVNTTFNYTGVSSNTLTGVTSGTGTLASGAAVFSIDTNITNDDFEVVDPDNATNGGFYNSFQTTLMTRTWLYNTSFNVGTQVVRPNSSATAIQWLRNDTSRVDLLWDNSGSAGAFSYQNNSVLDGRTGTTTGTRTWQLDGSNGAVRPGTASGMGARMFSGSGAPTLSATSGDFYLRTDTPTTANQRLYVCTGTTTWTGIL